MKAIASLLASAATVLFAASAHAGTIAPGIGLSLLNGTTNYTFVQTVPGTFVAADGLNSVTVVYANVPGVLDTFTVADVCLNVGPVLPCKGYTLAISDSNAAGISLGAGLSVAAQADTSLSTNLATIDIDGSLGAGVETINFVLPSSPSNGPGGASPVPEPGTLGLMATGLIGAAGAIRRRFSL